MKYIIVGSGRCGTKFMSRALQNAKLDVRHERMGEDGTADWHAIKAPGIMKTDRVLHVVRDPLKASASFQTAHPDSWVFILKHSEVNRNLPLHMRCLQHWINWNKMCEEVADLTWPISEIDHPIIHEFFDRQIPFDSVPTTINTRQYDSPTWDMNHPIVEEAMSMYRSYFFELGRLDALHTARHSDTVIHSGP